MCSVHFALPRRRSALLLGPVALLPVTLLSAGCDASDRIGKTGPGRSDSAGVEIVRNPDEPQLRGELVLPARRVFGSEEEGPELFAGVSARLHPNGSLWISEGVTREIRVFDPGSGAHLFTIGGRGDGPGEFRQSSLLGFDAEGTAYVYDYRHRRLSVFSESGEFQRDQLMPSSLGIGPRPHHVTRTGTLLGQLPQGMERRPPDGSTVRDTARIWTIPLDGAVPILVAETPSALWYFHGRVQVVVPYTGILPPPYDGGSLQGYRDDRVYVTDHAGGTSYSVYGPAGLERRVEIKRAPRRIDHFSATAFVEQLRRSRFSESRVRSYEKHLSDMPIREARRAWDYFVVTDEGGAWLRRTGDAEAAIAGVPPEYRVWDVFDAEGVFVGPVRLPANVRPAQVWEESVLMVVYDDMGRSTVAIHDVRWTGSGAP